MVFSRRWLAAAFAGSMALFAGAEPARADGGETIGFNRDIRPILSDKCFFCHGPDKSKRKSGLRLDVRDSAFDAGAIVPGKPDESAAWQRIVSGDPDDLMPPPEAHKPLSSGEKDLLRRWIEQGAPYEPHWAYVRVQRPALPATHSETWIESPIDAFILQRLRDEGLTPSAPADRRTLLRRLSLDLIGLPPTPAELAAFERDRRPDAVLRQIDRLLASPHYGERMAVPWLDLVRFADTVGYHGDQNQNIFPYRDYVINAFNDNLPFDRFTLEQLAGDLLPGAPLRALIASGFNRLNMITREGGAQPGEYLAKYMADRVRAVGTVWLGSTLGCAQCHDHKYDPITARDFYSMGAFFADIREWGVYSDYTFTPNPDLKNFTNDYPFPPEIEVESPYLVARARQLGREHAAALRAATRAIGADAGSRRALQAWLGDVRSFLRRHRDGWAPLPLSGLHARTDSAPVSAGPAGTVTASLDDKHKQASFDIVLVPEETGHVLAAFRLDLLPQPVGTRRAISRLELVLRRDGEERALPLSFADAAYKLANPDNGHVPIDIVKGWLVGDAHPGASLTSVWELAEPVRLAKGDELVVRVQSQRSIVRLSSSPLAGFAARAAPSHLGPNRAGKPCRPVDVRPRDVPVPPPGCAGAGVGRADALAIHLARATATAAGTREIFLLSAPGEDEARRRVQRLHRALRETRRGRTPTMVTVAQAPRITRVLPRGNWQDESGEVVDPATPHFLPPLALPAGTRATRLDLAHWLVARDNPLTARTFVNRLWKQFFGSGLSAVLDDFGGQGEPPTHPALLDWLAVEFMESGWNVKHMIKLLVSSATYQQQSRVRPELLAKDPGNRLLARQSQRRLEAEFIRDNALAVAGLLNRDRGGPSVFPYQPPGYYENLEFPRREYVVDEDDRQYRRGVYMHWQRTFLHPMLANFDAPSREECAADRPQSNTPQQALTLLNDPTFVAAARVFAARSLRDEPKLDDDERLARAFERATGRRPQDDERRVLLELLDTQRRHFAGTPDMARSLIGAGQAEVVTGVPAVEQAAWTQVTRVILNAYDAVTKV